MAQNSRLPQIIIGAVVVGGIAFFMTEPQDEAPLDGDRPDRTRSTRSTDSKLEAFNEEDENAVFVRLTEPVNNAFKPLVARSSARGSEATNLMPNQVPPYMVNGETGWFYTGTAYIDQVPSVLLENTSTGTGQYLRVGESLMNARVTKITPNTVVLAGANGAGTRTLTLIENRPIVDDFGGVFTSSEPLNPMTGPIGLTANDQETTNNPDNISTETNLNNTNDPLETQAHEAP